MTVRSSLQGKQPSPSTHAALWIDRFFPGSEKAGAAATHLEGALESIRVPSSYVAFFQRWKDALESSSVTAKAIVLGRMAVGLGGESVLETSITLHRTYGVPYIPGSALKGLAACSARKRSQPGHEWHPGGKAFETVFGVLEDAGFVTFHDALWIPEGTDLPLHRDVMTVHHAEYYQGKDVQPADWDDPNPVAFLTAYGSYHLALSGPREWAEAAMDLLKIGLLEDGIGAKTAAGYGRMEVDWAPRHIQVLGSSSNSGSPGGTKPRREPGGRAAPIHIPWQPRVQALAPGNAESTIGSLLKDYQAEELREAAQAAVKVLTHKWLNDPRRREKEWVQALLSAASAPA